MREAITPADALPLAQAISDALEAAYEDITALDAEVGDGDLGVTCRLGMAAVVGLLPGLEGMSLGEMALKAGMAFNQAGASTFGALVATAAMRVAKYAKDTGVTEWGLAEVIAGATAAAEGIEQRGKAARGDKTILDAMWPAIEAMQAAQGTGKGLGEALAAAAGAAEAGAEATKPLKSKFGRAAWMQERTIGVQDAGATVAAVVAKAVADYAM
jgi:phosphoenolpyruvate---glycerone phosphotransferase subunit DhaL